MKLIRTVIVSAVLAVACAACSATAESVVLPRAKGQAGGDVRLVAYDTCAELLGGMREKAAAQVGPHGFGLGYFPEAFARADGVQAEAAPGRAADFSATNVHEAGVDEPDLIKTDGRRVLTVAKGVLRVIDAASRRVTGTLRLVDDERQDVFAPADLLLSGDRALVLMRGFGLFRGMAADVAAPSAPRYVIVDLSAAPKVIGTVRTSGVHVDARMVGSTVRLVTRSVPEIKFPQVKGDVSEAERIRVNQAAVRRAPLDAWLPKIELTDASGVTRSDRIGCARVSHPAEYTGTSLLTVHTVDLARGLTPAGTDPVALAADGETVYSNGAGFYVASNPRWWGPWSVAGSRGAAPMPPEETEVHRFDVGRPGAPRYVASAKAPGRLLNQYSLSEHGGELRVATTTTTPSTRFTKQSSSSGVYVFDTGTMAKVGEVTGLGRGERVYSVRFMGPVGYVVTFKQVDPLYTLDLRDPAAPKVTGELKITGFSAYLHPAGEGRLIGVGQEAGARGQTLGTQLSLFDVRDPARPVRLARFFQPKSGSDAEWDPHAFLYWPRTGLTVLPVNSYSAEGGDRSGAIALRVTDSAVTELGRITHPRIERENTGYRPGIQRSLVIGDSLWTLSEAGLQLNELTTLDEQAFIKLP